MLQGYVPEVTATGSKEKFRKKVMEEARKNSYMKIIDLLFFKKKQECSESDWHNKGMIEICEKYYSDIKENIQDDRLSIHSVWGYLRHIPRGKEDVGYSKDVSKNITKNAKKKYKEILLDLPEFEPDDHFKLNIISCALLIAFILTFQLIFRQNYLFKLSLQNNLDFFFRMNRFDKNSSYSCAFCPPHIRKKLVADK